MPAFPSYTECKNELFSLLKVVKYLDTETISSKPWYPTLCNGNIIILGTLFECFTENIIQEYVDGLTVRFNNRDITYMDLPNGIKDYMAKEIISKHYKKEFSEIHYGDAKKLISGFMQELDSDGFLIDKELDGINKFSFGKHGENEIKKTFKRIGVDIENVIGDFDDLNNFFRLRNGIVHPESISLTRGTLPSPRLIKKNILLLYLYIKSINKHLQNKAGAATDTEGSSPHLSR